MGGWGVGWGSLSRVAAELQGDQLGLFTCLPGSATREEVWVPDPARADLERLRCARARAARAALRSERRSQRLGDRAECEDCRAAALRTPRAHPCQRSRACVPSTDSQARPHPRPRAPIAGTTRPPAHRRFVGNLMAGCLRSKERLALSLPPYAWHCIAGHPPAWAEYAGMDPAKAQVTVVGSLAASALRLLPARRGLGLSI